MRNKVQLYIGGKRADLDDGSFILFTYTAEELTNPTIVRNSFSRQITLKGTPTNDEIFGHIYRNDRLTEYGGGATGPDFDPTRKTPFTIYNEMGEILEDGYLKLNKVVRKGAVKEYAVTLYGGLGSFLYGLSYDANGEKLTLADLDYGETLDFTVNRSAVADAWERIGGNTSKPAKWDIINFAPCYNGKPVKPFDANKCVVHAATVGLPEKDGDYSTVKGFSLVTLDNDVTEQETKDYRSYLQRPVLKMSALINAICDPANNGGWTVNLDPVFFNNINPYFNDLWLTLPQLNELNINVSQASGQMSLPSFGSTVTIPGGGSLSEDYDIVVSLDISIPFNSVLANEHYFMFCEDDWAAGMSPDDTPGYYFNWVEIEIEAFDGNGISIQKNTFRISTRQGPEGYAPKMDYVADSVYVDYDGNYGTFTGKFYKNGFPATINFTISDIGIKSVKVSRAVKGVAWGHLRGSADPMLMWRDGYYDFTESATVDYYALKSGTVGFIAIGSSTVRTDATVDKAALLAGEHTPADYLLSYCKLFGLHIIPSGDTKTIDILQRDNFYNGGTVDISGRIDRGKEISKLPFSFDARWYLFDMPVQGEFADYYANKYGGQFGQYRVNTGYDFDAEDRRMTDKIVFRGGCEVLETSKFFFDLDVDGVSVPPVLLAGGKYALYKSGGELKSYDLPAFPLYGRTWLNPSNPLYDDIPKLQVHGADNEHQDGRDTLLFFYGMESISSKHTTLSDDTREMLNLNGNNPCWLPGYCDHEGSWKLSSIPRFSRYVLSGPTVNLQLDWGDPKEVQLPGISFGFGSCIFEGFWKKYISDRYDDDSAVVTAWVDLRGMQVGPDLLRQFYAFDGAVWALNRIIEYSLTTDGPTKCEFVKVQDITNYTTL